MVPAEERETAIVIAVDVPALDAVYREEYPAFHALGIPLHATLLYPFVRPDELDDALPRLTQVLEGHPRFTFTLTELKTFPRTVWVAPVPASPFVALTHALEAEFATSHMGGAFAEVIPHVTLADGLEESRLDETVQRLRPVVEPLLPVTLSADEVVVLGEQEDGRMPIVARVSLG